jgi:hypothetical protein
VSRRVVAAPQASEARPLAGHASDAQVVTGMRLTMW